MAIKYSKYGCQFKCGHRLLSSKEKIEKHETKCWNNPENKSCKTCLYESYYVEIDQTTYHEQKAYYVRECLNKIASNILDEKYEQLQVRNSIHIKPIMNCQYHNLKLKEKLIFLTK